MSEVYCTALSGGSSGGGQTAPFGALGLAAVCCEHRERWHSRRPQGPGDTWRQDKACLSLFVSSPMLLDDGCTCSCSTFWKPHKTKRGTTRAAQRSREPRHNEISDTAGPTVCTQIIPPADFFIFFLWVTHTALRPHKQDIYLTDVNTNRQRRLYNRWHCSDNLESHEKVYWFKLNSWFFITALGMFPSG